MKKTKNKTKQNKNKNRKKQKQNQSKKQNKKRQQQNISMTVCIELGAMQKRTRRFQNITNLIGFQHDQCTHWPFKRHSLIIKLSKTYISNLIKKINFKTYHHRPMMLVGKIRKNNKPTAIENCFVIIWWPLRHSKSFVFLRRDRPSGKGSRVARCRGR